MFCLYSGYLMASSYPWNDGLDVYTMKLEQKTNQKLILIWIVTNFVTAETHGLEHFFQKH